jgi:hypothetical protein
MNSMNDDKVQQLNQDLKAEGLRTVERFSTDAIDLFNRRGNSAVLTRYLQDWENTHYNPKDLRLNILNTLEFKRHELRMWQLRSDVSRERLHQIIDELEDGTIVQRFKDVVIVDDLVDWCNAYISLAAKLLVA